MLSRYPVALVARVLRIRDVDDANGEFTLALAFALAATPH